jgi:hypothetical protein
VVSNDHDLIGLSSSTPDGQALRLAERLSGQTGWRRIAAKGFAVVCLAGIFAGVVVILVALPA